MTIPYLDLRGQHAPLRERLAAAFDRVLDHGQFVLGPEVGELEHRLADVIGVEHVVTCGSGTDALVLALRAHGIGSGDEVITVAHSFVATANAIALVGAAPVFVDVDEATMTMDPDELERAVRPRTRAVMPVHLGGFPCDLDPIERVCERHGLALIEDCAQALGARRQDRSVGTTDAGCFSLHPAKPLSACGDGGFVTTTDGELAARLRRLGNHGLVDRDHCAVVGANSRLDTVQAAIVLVKLPHLHGWIEDRRAHASAYRAALAGRLALPPDDPDAYATYSTFVVRHPERDRLSVLLHERGVDVRIHYPLALHQQPPFSGCRRRGLAVTERIVGQILSLPVGPELSVAERDHVIVAVSDALGAFE